jgi:HipA-like protein
MTKELYVLMDNRRMGRVRQGNNGKLSFVYDEQWRNAETSYPLSLSMPLALSEHPHDKIDAFLWGLLPDNEGTLRSHLGGGRRLRWCRAIHPAGTPGRPKRCRPGHHPVAHRKGDRRAATHSSRKLCCGTSSQRRRTVQSCWSTAENSFPVRRRQMGRSLGTYTHNAHPQTAHRRIRRPR